LTEKRAVGGKRLGWRAGGIREKGEHEVVDPDRHGDSFGRHRLAGDACGAARWGERRPT
jgi:hypothetical protein